jgi:hypothetical protein
MQTPSNDRPTTLRALAARCCAGETTDELRDAVLIALGQPPNAFAPPAMGTRCMRIVPAPNPLTDLNASAAAMPAGLYPVIERHKGGWEVVLWEPIEGEDGWEPGSEATAPTEPLARTAAALMARAAELENTK